MFWVQEETYVSEKCPYLIDKCIGHRLVTYCLFQPHLPTANNQVSGVIFDAGGNGCVDKIQKEKKNDGRHL